ncbi:MAG: hypothetical protein JJU02_02785, partial [Cryomorphaceae bacterium]|nr:hypothetical protein [Cryomorphaceae bacterium]
MKDKLFYLLLIFSLLSCKKENRDDELHLQQTPHLEEELRIDGFYYYTFNEGQLTRIFFLFRNGVIQGGLSYPGNNWEQRLEEDINSGLYREMSLKYKTMWGLFEIEDSILRFEKWYPKSPGPKIAAVREGVILNDTTFHILSSYRFENGKKVNIRERDERYHFREFSPKPDS